MHMKNAPASARRPVNLSLDESLVVSARSLDINISRACETGLARAVKEERERRWRETHREMIEANNLWIEQNGLPLEDYRLF